MNPFEKFKELIRKDADKRLLVHIPPQRAGRDDDYVPLEAGRHYLRIWLSEMFLKHERVAATNWYPAVHSQVQLQFGSQQVAIPTVADASRVGLNQNSRGDVIARNFLLTPLLPFNGGVVQVEAGLLGIQGENFLASFVQVLGEFSALLAVPQLSAALNVAAPLANGVQRLFDQGSLHLGLHSAFSAGEQGGYYTAIRATEHDVDVSQLHVVDGALRYGVDAASSRPFTGYDYMLLRLEVTEERDDWRQLDKIEEPYRQALEALSQFEEQKAQMLLVYAIVNALRAPELTTADRRRVTTELRKMFDQDREDIGLGRLVEVEESPLERAARNAMPAGDALKLGEPTVEEILA